MIVLPSPAGQALNKIQSLKRDMLNWRKTIRPMPIRSTHTHTHTPFESLRTLFFLPIHSTRRGWNRILNSGFFHKTYTLLCPSQSRDELTSSMSYLQKSFARIRLTSMRAKL